MTPTKELNEKFELLPISSIAESSTNPRKTFNEKEMAELTASVSTEGVVVPILVRPHPKPNGVKQEVVAGARRLRAAIGAGLKSIPAIIRHYTDEQVLIIQNVENLQRADVHPLEEADGYQALLRIDGYTPEIISEKIGHPPAYVYKRLALTTLIQELREAFLSEQDFTISHALLLARLPEDNQRFAFANLLFDESGGRHVPGKGWVQYPRCLVRVSELDQAIKSSIFLDLSAAPWKKDNAELLPAAGACNVCPKRTGANVLLFEDIPAKGDMCLDAACFQLKAEAQLIQITAVKKEAGIELKRLSIEYSPDDELNALPRRQYEEIVGKIKKCVSITEGVFVDGPRKGQTIRVCADMACKIHHEYSSNYSGSSSSSGSKKSFWDEKAGKLKTRIEVAIRRATVAAIIEKPMKWTIPQEHLQVIATAMLPGSLPTDLLDALELPGVPLGQKLNGSDVSKILADFISAGKGTTKAAELPRIVIALSLADRMKEFDFVSGAAEKLAAAAKAFGVDAKKVATDTAKTMQTEFDEKRAKSEAKKAAAEAPKAPKTAKGKAKAAPKAKATKKAGAKGAKKGKK